MTDIRKKLNDFFVRGVWEIDTDSLGKLRSFVIKSLRLLYVAIREFTEGQLTLRAMSLVYTTLLSIVPLLAISFSVLKAFGVHNQVVEPFLLKFLAPLGDRGEEITFKIIGFVENMKVGVLGSIGLGLLIYTIISAIHKIESAFNSIWRINKSRSLARKFSDYISVMIIGPVLVFTAIGLTTSLMSTAMVQKLISIEPFGSFFYFMVKISPYILISSTFTFIYIFIPNTKVKFRSALFGGVLAGVLWEATGWAFASFIVSSTKYAAVYSGFAILIMFMIWVYLSWIIVLVGGQVSFYHQYPQFLTAKKEVFSLSNRLRERLAFSVMFLICYNFHHNKKPWSLNSLVERMDLPVEPIYDVLNVLEQNNLIIETHDDPPAYSPARDIDTITLKEFLRSVRANEKEAYAVEKKIYFIPEIDEVMKMLDEAISNSLGDKTLKSLVISKREDI